MVLVSITVTCLHRPTYSQVHRQVQQDAIFRSCHLCRAVGGVIVHHHGHQFAGRDLCGMHRTDHLADVLLFIETGYDDGYFHLSPFLL
jgi:hypothetical protein